MQRSQLEYCKELLARATKAAAPPAKQTAVVEQLIRTGLATAKRSNSVYAALAEYLGGLPKGFPAVQLTFAQIEKITDHKLPNSARQHLAWWANDSVGHTHSKLWLDKDWRSGRVSLEEEIVDFHREGRRLIT